MPSRAARLVMISSAKLEFDRAPGKKTDGQHEDADGCHENGGHFGQGQCTKRQNAEDEIAP